MAKKVVNEVEIKTNIDKIDKSISDLNKQLEDFGKSYKKAFLDNNNERTKQLKEQIKLLNDLRKLERDNLAKQLTSLHELNKQQKKNAEEEIKLDNKVTETQIKNDKKVVDFNNAQAKEARRQLRTLQVTLKTMQSSSEIENWIQTKPKFITTPDSFNWTTPSIDLNETSAKAIFFKDNHFKGSISRLESYARCPFSHALKYGLYLKENEAEAQDAVGFDDINEYYAEPADLYAEMTEVADELLETDMSLEVIATLAKTTKEQQKLVAKVISYIIPRSNLNVVST